MLKARLDARVALRRVANFVDVIGEGRGCQALAKALVETERWSRSHRVGDRVPGKDQH